MSRRVLIAHLAFLAACCLSSCRNEHLTRSSARAQLEQLARVSQRSNAPHTMLVQIGTVGNCEPKKDPNFEPVETSPETHVLASTGFLTVTPIKLHLWNVELTDSGKASIQGEKYAHEQKGDCDQWQVTIPLAKYDHLEVTGIVEEGIHAKADIEVTYLITPVATAARKVAHDIILAQDTKTFGSELAQKWVDDKVKSLVSDDVFYALQDSTTYTNKMTVEFDKYDDGWKPSQKRQ